MTGGIYALKPRFQSHLAGAVRVLVQRGVSADAITAAGVAMSALAAAAITASTMWPLLLLAAAPLVIVRLACNALDGMIATATGTGRSWGMVLNETADRVSDIVIVAAVGWRCGWPLTGALVICGALLCSHAGVLSRAAGGSRQYGGVMGKADRMLALAAAALAQVVLPEEPVLRAYLVIVAAGLAATLGQRLVATHRELACRSRVGDCA